MPECYCGQPLDGHVHAHSQSVWCYPDEWDVLDKAQPVP